MKKSPMRQRNIFHILTRITLVLALFVLYQTWIKTAWQSAPDSAPAPDESALRLPHEEPATPVNLFPEPDVPPSRLVFPGPVTDNLLRPLWDELDRGNLKAVEAGLRALPDTRLASANHRLYAAALWNNLGVQREKFGGVEWSIGAFQQAAALAPENAVIHLNLTQAYWARRDPAMTQDFLAHVIRLAPTDPFPRLALAELSIEKGQFEPAARYLNDAASAARRHPDLDAYAHRLKARIPHNVLSPAPMAAHIPVATLPRPPVAATTEPVHMPQPVPVSRNPVPAPVSPTDSVEQTPRQLHPHTADHFVIRFDGTDDQETWTRLRAVLEYAYQDLSQKFGYAPPAPITVVLHTQRKFDDPGGSPAWADTLFDEERGIIHVPGQGALEDLGLLSRVVRHEFAHALFHQKLGAHARTTPRWLLEGLALQLAEDPWPDLEGAKTGGGSLIPLHRLGSGWTSLERTQVAPAYLESLSAAQSLTDRYSMYEVRQLLNLIQTGQTLAQAMQNKLSTSYESFERQWTSTMTSGLKPDRS